MTDAQTRRALLDLYKWATGPDRSGNPHSKPEVHAANLALGGDGYTLPDDVQDATITVIAYEDPSDESTHPHLGVTSTLGEFLALNTTLEPAIVAEIRALEVGHRYHGGGGAEAAWMIRRLA